MASNSGGTSAGNGHIDPIIRAVQITDSLGRIISDEIAVKLAERLAESPDSPLGDLASGKIPGTWNGWRELAMDVARAGSRKPGSVLVRQLRFWAEENAQCSQCGLVMDGVVTGTSSPIDIEDCNECGRYTSPLEAAYALARQVGGQVWFYQHDPEQAERVAERINSGDVHLQLQTLDSQGFSRRTYSPDKIGSVSVLFGTNPWIEIGGEPVNWNHTNAVLLAVQKMREEPEGAG